MNSMPVRVTFRAVLVSVAALYVAYSFLTQQLVTQLPVNWFITWLGGIFTLMDREGFLNIWSGLTPGAHYLYFLTWKPAQVLSGGQWYFAIVFSLLWYAISMGGVFLGAYLFNKIVEHIWGKTRALVLGTIYLVLFLTFDWYTVVDSLAIAALLAAIYSFIKGSGRLGGILGGILLAISVAVKPMGAVVLPVIIRSEFMPRKARAAFVATFVPSIAILFAPFVLGNFSMFMSSVHWQSGRAPWESVYALGLWLFNRPLPNDPFFLDYSGVAARDWAWSGITPVHSIMTSPVPAYSPWYNELFLGLLFVALAGFLLLKRIRSKTDLLWGSFYGLCAYFALFYGWSVQFYYWLAPFMLTSLPLGVPVFMKIAALLEYPLFYGLYLARKAPDLVTSTAGLPVSWTAALSQAAPFGYWFLVSLRTALILGLAILAWRTLATRLWEPAGAFRRFWTALGGYVPNPLRSRS